MREIFLTITLYFASHPRTRSLFQRQTVADLTPIWMLFSFEKQYICRHHKECQLAALRQWCCDAAAWFFFFIFECKVDCDDASMMHPRRFLHLFHLHISHHSLHCKPIVEYAYALRYSPLIIDEGIERYVGIKSILSSTKLLRLGGGKQNEQWQVAKIMPRNSATATFSFLEVFCHPDECRCTVCTL